MHMCVYLSHFAVQKKLTHQSTILQKNLNANLSKKMTLNLALACSTPNNLTPNNLIHPNTPWVTRPLFWSIRK